MVEKNLPVPYKSQHDSDSTNSRSDCGPASLAMLAEFKGRPTTTGEVLAELEDNDFVNFDQLENLAREWGFGVERKNNASFDTIKDYLNRDLPVIVVGGYKYLSSTQDKNFKGSHIMVVCGYREEGGKITNVFCNDPNFYPPLRNEGDHHNYTAEEFFTFWRNEGNAEKNNPNTLFVLTGSPKAKEEPKESGSGEVVKVEIDAPAGIRARSAPLLIGFDPKKEETNIVIGYKVGTVLNVVETVKGVKVEDTIKGVFKSSDNWYKIKENGKDAFIWSGGCKVVETKQPIKTTPTPTEKPNVVVPAQTDDYLQGILTMYKISRDILKKNNMLPEETDGFWTKLRKSLGI